MQHRFLDCSQTLIIMATLSLSPIMQPVEGVPHCDIEALMCHTLSHIA